MTKLPNGWEQPTLDEFISSNGLFCDGDWVESKDQDPNGKVRLIQLADIGDGVFRDKSSRFLTTEKAEELSCSYLKKGDILVARMPDPLGRACIFPMDGEQQFVTVVDVCIVRPGTKLIDSKLLAFLINSPKARKEIDSLQSGSTRKRISRKNLATIQFPLPPLNEQHRIVAKIEELFSELEKGVESLKTAREQLKVYRQSVLKAAFEGRLTESWRKELEDELESADELLTRIKAEREARYAAQLAEWQQSVETWEAEGGAKGSRAKKPTKPKKPKELPPLTAEELADLPALPEGWAYAALETISFTVSDGDHQAPPKADEGIPFITISNIKNNVINFSDTKYVPQSYFDALSPERKPMKGDILYTVTGSFGIPSLVNFNLEFCFQRHIGLIRPTKSTNVLYLYYLLTADLVYKQALAVATGTAQKTVPLSGLREFKLPVPCQNEQHQIVQEIESRFSVVEKMEQTIDESLQKAEALRQSILKRAFEGKLVPQDPTDEPASELLARIRAERGKVPATGRKKKEAAA